jgi:sortase A
VLVAAVAGCTAPTTGSRTSSPSSTSAISSEQPPSAAASGGKPSSTAAAGATPGTSPSRPAAPTTPPASTGVAVLAIPALGVRALRVVPYSGTADDAPGTRIQDGGVAASPRGARGGVGPGAIGNYIVTGHRTSGGAPFRRLPALPTGAQILVTSGGFVYDYRVTQTMTISFRKPRDLAAQSAPVPGRPGERPTRAMITLSTCATPEDRAAGNFWTDKFGNPEHRINKIGVLVAVRPR